MIWTKMSGAGNSFWLAFLPKNSFDKKKGAKLAQKLCLSSSKTSKAKNPSTDGLSILLKSSTADFQWLFYNADGSPAEMCGNAACCITKYVFKKKLLPRHKKYVILKIHGRKIKGALSHKQAQVFLKQSQKIQSFKSSFNKKPIPYMFIDSGVPHAVIETKQTVPTLQKKLLAKKLRTKTRHHKNGMNVSFYCKKTLSKNKKTLYLSAYTFERGVEDFTPACGTGALAVAQVCYLKWPELQSVFVQMPGGRLKVSFHSNKIVSLISPVKQLKEKEFLI